MSIAAHKGKYDCRYKGDNERQGDYEKLAAVWANIWTEEKPTTDT